MARISGVNLPSSKRVEYGLTYVYGIGLPTSRKILNAVNVNFDTRVKDLTDQEISAIQQEITRSYETEGDLRKRISADLRRLMEIGSYRGSRHKRGLPARGQRTKTNARTRKGPRKQGGQIALKSKVTKK